MEIVAREVAMFVPGALCALFWARGASAAVPIGGVTRSRPKSLPAPNQTFREGRILKYVAFCWLSRSSHEAFYFQRGSEVTMFRDVMALFNGLKSISQLWSEMNNRVSPVVSQQCQLVPSLLGCDWHEL